MGSRAEQVSEVVERAPIGPARAGSGAIFSAQGQNQLAGLGLEVSEVARNPTAAISPRARICRDTQADLDVWGSNVETIFGGLTKTLTKRQRKRCSRG